MVANGADANGRVVDYAGLIEAGVSRHVLARRVTSGQWRRLHPQVYFTGRSPTFRDRCQAALRWAGDGATVTGQAALVLYGVPRPDPGVIDVLVPEHRRRISDGSPVRLRRTRYLDDDDRLVRAGITVVRFERAVIDICRTARLADVRALVCDVVQGGYTLPAKLAVIADSLTGATGPHLRPVLVEVASGARSVAECELAELLAREGLDMFVRQHPLPTPGGTAWLDFFSSIHGLGLEVDGEQWHVSAAAWRRDLARQNAIQQQGIVLLRFSPRDIRTRPDHIIATIRAALASRPAAPAALG